MPDYTINKQIATYYSPRHYQDDFVCVGQSWNSQTDNTDQWFSKQFLLLTLLENHTPTLAIVHGQKCVDT